MIIDAHVHFGALDGTDRLEKLRERMLSDLRDAGIEQLAIAVPERSGKKANLYAMADALWFKNRDPDKVYVFGGLRFDFVEHGVSPNTPDDLVAQLDELIEMGCDGLKLLMGKPDSRKDLGMPLDVPVLTPLFERLEKTGFPIVWHIADPPEFWNRDTTPLWARQNNWWYDETHLSFEAIRAEAERVFKRHPNLNLILPHFYFLSNDLKEAEAFLVNHPNINLDTSPGVEMCHNLSNDTAAAKDFFERHADRIVFGTDTGMDAHSTSPARPRMVRSWLESDGVVPVPPDDPCMMPDDKDAFNALALSGDALAKIFSENFSRIVGSPTPKPLERGRVKTFCEQMIVLNLNVPIASRLLREIS